jgi:predicted dehydrogenase
VKKVLLIGTGYMAKEYVKVLKDLEVDYVVIGNSKDSCEKFQNDTGIKAQEGGIETFIKNNKIYDCYVINAVNAEKLYETTKLLLENNIKNILVEKPAALYKKETNQLYELSKRKNANVFVAYNRRFYASTLKAKEIIKNDKGVTSFNFEFTEWAHEIEKLDKPKSVLERWFIANSTHVVDLAFYLGGVPKEICCYTSGSLNWHPSASVFSGSGISESGALFSYFANWESAGRWSVEILTKKHKLIFRPMEKLQIQKKGSINQEFVEIEYSLDEKYKPGVYLQTKVFLTGKIENLCTLSEQLNNFDLYLRMANYSEK